MHNGRRPVFRLLAFVFLAPGIRSAEAQCPPPAPLAAAENSYMGTMAQQAAPENGGPRTIIATRLDAGDSIEVDGRLDEAIWARTLPAGDFHAWVACESAAAKALRAHLVGERGAHPKWVRASGDWRRGAVAAHDTHED